MKKITPVWFWLFLKRLLVRKSFVLFLLLLPLLAAAVNAVSRFTSKNSLEVGICWQSGGLAQLAGEHLTTYEGAVTFLPYDNGEQMKKDILSKKVQWGYVLTENMEQAMLEGQAQRTIVCYETPASFLSKMTDEIVFSAVMRYHGETILTDYAKNSGLFSQREIEKANKELPTAYKEYLEGGSTFSFRYQTLDGSLDTGNVFTTPIRGICALLILIGGLFGAMMTIENERKGLYKRLSPKERVMGNILTVFAPVCLLSVSAWITLFVSGAGQSIMGESLQLGAYALGISGFCYFLAVLLHQESILCGAIPVLTMGSLVCSPIFFDISMFLPQVAGIKWIFLPTYYLNNMAFSLLLWSVFAIAVGVGIARKRQ